MPQAEGNANSKSSNKPFICAAILDRMKNRIQEKGLCHILSLYFTVFIHFEEC